MSGPEHSTLPEREIAPAFGTGVFPDLAPGRTVGAGRFRLDRQIGMGGMGVVWKAFDQRLNEPVALKFLSSKIRANPVALEAMRRETSRSHSLSHPNIVRTHDIYEAEGEPVFLSMEYVEGRTLHEIASDRDHRAVPWAEVKPWLAQLGAALAHAHARGVIHRDLKPGNILLTPHGDVKLTDFGLASSNQDRAHTLAGGSTGGTLVYMSPQQLRGDPGTALDDIYSLGACLFELLSGIPVFRGPDVARQIERDPAPSLLATLEERGIAPPIPEELDDLVQHCLSKNPRQRPQSIEHVLKAAGILKTDEPSASDLVEARAADERPRRSRALRIAVSVVAVLLAATAVIVPRIRRPEAPPASGYLDLTLASVRASSFHPPYTPEKAFDRVHRHLADDAHRWVTETRVGTANEWIAVDLGANMRVDRIAIDWELAYARGFSVSSRTGSEGFAEPPAQWTERGDVQGLTETLTLGINDADSKEDVVFDFSSGRVQVGSWVRHSHGRIERQPFVARHILIHLTQRGSNPGVYSIHEILIAAQPAGRRNQP